MIVDKLDAGQEMEDLFDSSIEEDDLKGALPTARTPQCSDRSLCSQAPASSVARGILSWWEICGRWDSHLCHRTV